MKIAGIAFQLPSRRLTNRDVLNQIRTSGTHLSSEDVEVYCAQIGKLLIRAGAETRYIRDKSKGETALDLMLSAARDALAKADMHVQEIDLVLFCGVGRGFLEPSNAAFICRALNATCDYFDVSDACMSWVRATHVANSFLRTKAYSKILIINGEFTLFEAGEPNLFSIKRLDQIQYNFPAYTIGEAASAVVLVNSPSNWNFHFRSNAALAPLCTIPLKGYRDFSQPDEHIGLNGVGNFVSFGHELTLAAFNTMLPFVKQTYNHLGDIDIWFPHAANATLNSLVARRLGVADKLYGKVFPKLGNIISASIPVALAMAIDDGALLPGTRFVLCPVSAGMSFALVDGSY